LLSALALLAAAAPVPAARAALPDLVADPPGSPYLQEWDFEGSRHRLLRFDGYIRNVGPGRLQVEGSRNADGVMSAVSQRTFEPMAAFAIPALLLYEENDGHRHWHLRNAARYSLWSLDGAAEVARSSKIGFCLVDAIQVAEDAPGSYWDSCRANEPGAPNVTMGLSAGWSDHYDDELWMQWVDVSDVAPGRYRLRSEVDPDGVVREAQEANAPADTTVEIPGWVARRLDVERAEGTTWVRLAADAVGGGLGPPRFRIVEGPRHGTLDVPVGEWLAGDVVGYTPAPGAPAKDGFTYSVRERDGRFPLAPPSAAVTIRGAGGQPPIVAAERVDVSGAPARMVVATSVQLAASVPGVTWSASTGQVSPGGLFTGPRSPGFAVVRATAPSGAFGEASIRIVAAPPRRPVPGACGGTAVRTPLGRLCAARAGRSFVVSAVPARAGRLRVTLVRDGRAERRCRWSVRAGRRYGCRFRVAPAPGLRVVLTLRTRSGALLSHRLPVR
jgi:hypothetical protein